ncbi:MAG: hypothetical protein QNK63_02725 [Flavobacteriales bacterium]
MPFQFEVNTFKGTFGKNRLEFNIDTMNGMDKKASQTLAIDLSIPVSN